MTKGFIFWLLMLLILVFNLFFWWPVGEWNGRVFVPLGTNLLTWVLFFLLGWQVFGFMIKDS